MNNNKKRCLVISGGGSKGAFAGGIVEYLTIKDKKDYDMYISSSTGTLVQLLTSTGDIPKLKEGYTTVTNKDIWTNNPFKVTDNNKGKVKAELNVWSVIKNLLPSFRLRKNKKFPFLKIKKINGGISFGNSSNLLGLIKRFMSQKEYLRVKEELGKELIVCVVNATLKKVEYKSSTNWGYDDFCEWTQASCSAYPFMSPVLKNDFQYIDGGVLETVPIQEAIKRGATDVDVIVLNEENPEEKVEYMRNLVHGILTEIDMMHRELSKNDIQIGKLKAKDEDVIINFYYTPRRLTNNSLVFDKEMMTRWWDEGYEWAKQKNFKTYKVVKGRKTKLIKDITIPRKGR
jgi:predicted patatin/cPLA2 family phospholipase